MPKRSLLPAHHHSIMLKTKFHFTTKVWRGNDIHTNTFKLLHLTAVSLSLCQVSSSPIITTGDRLDTSSVMLKAIRSRSCNYYKQVVSHGYQVCVCVCLMFLRVFCLDGIPNKTAFYGNIMACGDVDFPLKFKTGLR